MVKRHNITIFLDVELVSAPKFDFLKFSRVCTMVREYKKELYELGVRSVVLRGKENRSTKKQTKK